MTGRALWPLRRDEAIAVAGSAASFALAFPPFPFGAALFCLAPVGVAIARAADDGADARAAARLGFWFGLLGYAACVYWVAPALALVTRLALFGYLAIILAAGMLTAAATAAIFALRRLTVWPMAVVLPVGWVGFEVLMASLPELAFPWLPLGLATAHQPALAQLADLSGVRGTSFALAAVNGLAVDAWLLRGDPRAIAMRGATGLAILGAMLAYGTWRLASVPVRPFAPIAIVQPNIAQREKWDEAQRERNVAAVAALSRRVPALGRAALIVWPEVALTESLEHHPEWRDTLRAVVRDADAPILFGIPELVRDDQGRAVYYNAAMLTDAEGEISQAAHRKRDLVPVIERVPFVGAGWLGGPTFLGAYSPGRMSVFEHPLGRIGTLICYESIFGGRARELRRAGGDLLVAITNDAWFGRTTAPWQHAAHLSLRAIENRVGIVRSANTGFSGHVDPLGRLHGRTSLFEPAVRLYEVRTSDVVAPYVRFGDWIGSLAGLATIAGVAAGAWRGRARPMGTSGER